MSLDADQDAQASDPAAVDDESWAPVEALRARVAEPIGTFGESTLSHIDGAHFGLELCGHLIAGDLLAALKACWTHPQGSPHWTLVVVVVPGASYEASVRDVYRAKELVPAVATAVVSKKSLHRLLIATLALPVRAMTGTVLSVHHEFDEAMAATEKALAKRLG